MITSQFVKKFTVVPQKEDFIVKVNRIDKYCIFKLDPIKFNHLADCWIRVDYAFDEHGEFELGEQTFKFQINIIDSPREESLVLLQQLTDTDNISWVSSYRCPITWIDYHNSEEELKSSTDVTYKPTNPKDLVGCNKAPSSTVPRGVMAEVGVGMLEGAMKYGRHNYRVIGVKSSIYFDAAIGHLETWWEGEDVDQDSGLHHITKAICSLVVLRDAMLQDKLNDDRPPKSLIPNMRQYMEDNIKELVEKYPNPIQPFTNQD